MNLAILHYHLNRGGVMQVIVNHLRALDAALDGRHPWRVALVYGGRRQGWPEDLSAELRALDVTLCEVPELDYDDDPNPQPELLGRRVAERLSSMGFSAQTTVIHVHNHSLGKNVSLPGAVRFLAEAGYPLLLQIHDFAEDFRPVVYARLLSALGHGNPAAVSAALYPQAEHIHYAVLNRRDAAVLEDAKFDAQHVHLLPNPVSELGPFPPKSLARQKLYERFRVPQDRLWMLYPVRGIARKNLGEVLLWAALLGNRASVGVTLAPLNPLEQPSYENWKTLTRELELPCVFELGGPEGLTFLENLAACDLVLTTSVAEGFGMTFLESWLAGRYLVGRDLPEITEDFLVSGLRLDSLNPKLWVPVDWIGRDEFCRSVQEAYIRVLAAYGLTAPADAQLRAAAESLIEDDLVDFASLGAQLQRQVISQVHAESDCRESVLALNRWMESSLMMDKQSQADAIDHNSEVVRSCYSPAACGRRLADLYQTVADSARSHPVASLDGGSGRILESFLNLSRFHPIRR